MKKAILLLAVCLTGMGHAVASDVLTVENVSLRQGAVATISVGGEFDTQFKGYQIDLELSDGVRLVLNESGKPVCENGFDGTDHTISSTVVGEGKYRFVCVSTSNTALPQNGVLLNLKVTGDGANKVGDIFDGKITAVEFTTLTTEVRELADAQFTISVIDPRLILDENSSEMPSKSDGETMVKVLRTINANEWCTICLPFAMTTEQVKAAFGDDVQLGDFTGYATTKEGDKIVGITVNFVEAMAIEANHPYIIKVAKKVTEFSADGVTIAPEDSPCVEYDNGQTGKKRKVLGTFAGTYVADFDFYNEANNYPLFLSENKFYYATENTKHMKAFRAYFDFEDNLAEAEGASSRIDMSFGSTTGIHATLNDKGEMINDNAVYDLQGRRVANPGKGVFVKDGKKVIIK